MSLPVRDHDPFCGIKGQYQVPCVICDRIEKVRADEREKFMAVERFMTERGEASIPKRVVKLIRADEREKAAQRVIALCAHTKYEGSAPCEHDRAADAVRGES